MSGSTTIQTKRGNLVYSLPRDSTTLNQRNTLFTFENVEQGRINFGKFASKPGSQEGSFVIPLDHDPETNTHHKVQAQTQVIDGWEILTAETIRVEPRTEGDAPLFLKSKYKPEDEFVRYPVPMTTRLVRDLKVWFWGNEVDCVMFIPKIEKESANLSPYLVKICHNPNAKLKIPHFLR